MSIPPFRFLHAGDLHLDSPITGLSAVAPQEVLSVLRAATTESWRSIVRTAIDEPVDFLLIAGDVFEVSNPTLLGQTRFRDGLAELAAHGIRSYVVHGNHDPMDGKAWAASLEFPELTHRFGTVAGESVVHHRDGQPVARIHGRSYPTAAVSENYATSFRGRADGLFEIGLLHTNVGDRPGHHNYAPCSVDDLRAAGMDYWALGHIHQPGVVLSDPPALYSGIPQGRDPGELGERGGWLVDVDATGRVTYRFVATDHVRWSPLNVDIGDVETDEALRAACRDAVEAAIAGADGRSLIVRLRLTGRGSMHATLRRTGYLDDLRTLLNEERSLAVPFAWVESIADDTVPEIDVDARRSAQDFVGDFLRTVAEARRSERTTDPEAHEHWQRLLRETVAPLFERAPRGRRYLAAPTDADLAGSLLDEAESMGLDLLVRAEEARD
ncbi:MAG TPA: DNA repair exonuclease [Candidatus Limnocylindria bacterium]|nr:DNA repair exonuclease [Candidatus Limnocylindria bacterium]